VEEEVLLFVVKGEGVVVKLLAQGLAFWEDLQMMVLQPYRLAQKLIYKILKK
jgi:hypothetical protein